MKKPRPPALVTAEKAAAILSSLERTPVSVAQVRSVLVLDTKGRAMPLADASGRATVPRRGQTRLYGAVDVALVRLALKLRKQGVSSTVSRVVLACLRDQLATHWQKGDPMALAVIGMRGLLLYAPSGRPELAAGWVLLADVWAGLEAQIRAQHVDTVWQWKPVSVAKLA